MAYGSGRGFLALGEGLNNFGGTLLRQLQMQKENEARERAAKMQEAQAGLSGIFMGEAPVDRLPGASGPAPQAPGLVGEGIVNRPQESVAPTVQSAVALEKQDLLKPRYTQGEGFFIDRTMTPEAQARRRMEQEFGQKKELTGIEHGYNVDLEGVRGRNALDLEGVRGQNSARTATIGANASVRGAQIGADATVRAAEGRLGRETDDVAAQSRALELIQRHGSADAAIAALPDHPGSVIVRREIERADAERRRREFLGVGSSSGFDFSDPKKALEQLRTGLGRQ